MCVKAGSCPVITNCNKYMESLIGISGWYQLLFCFHQVPPGTRDCAWPTRCGISWNVSNGMG